MIRKLQFFLCASLLLALISAPTLAADDLFISEAAGEISFAPNKAYGQARLVVAGPDGFRFDQTFEGEPASIALFSDSRNAVDGSYSWHLVVTSTISDDLRADMEKAREAGDADFMRRVREAGFFESQRYQGHFVVVRGSLIIPELSTEVEESAAKVNLPTKAQYFNEDVIADGSLCVGMGCTSSESFGFDTVRLKEDNLRIQFTDTSSSATFPDSDWEIVINDTSNGGDNYFAIYDDSNSKTPFKIESGASNNSLYVDSNGLVGIGESAPSEEVHVTAGDSPTLRLEQDGSAGFTPYKWDLFGNESGFFVRDTTTSGTLPFKVRAGNSNNTLVVRNNNVGVGLGNPAQDLHVKSTDGDGQLLVQETNSTVTQRVLLKLENKGIPSMQLEDTDSGDKWAFSVKSEGFEFSKGGTNVQEFVLDGSGNLTIAGSLTTANDTYADYVFDEGYELLSLEEVEAFILANGHLPNVKSEEEVEYGRRINLSELSIKLLEKVEELTLYAIDLNKRLAVLEAGEE